MDSNHCAKFHPGILYGFWDMLVDTEQQQQQQQQQQQEIWKMTFRNKSLMDCAILVIFGILAFYDHTDQIDMSEVVSDWNWK